MFKNTLRFLTPLVVFLLTCLSTALSQTGSDAIQPNERIIFGSRRDAQDDIFAIDGAGVTIRVTNVPFSNVESISCSPNGHEIAYSETGHLSIVDIKDLNNLDVSFLINIEERYIGDFSIFGGLAWSPAGDNLLFDRADLFMINVDGTGLQQLTNEPHSDSLSPGAWSPDGTQIAFSSLRNGNSEIYVMDASGANQTRITNDPSLDYSPAWSPDGSRIAFVSLRDGDSEIYLIDPDGNNVLQLTNNSSVDFDPAWSPDGSRIAFTSDRDGDLEIYVMDANGTNVQRITHSPGHDSRPCWLVDEIVESFSESPSGNTLAENAILELVSNLTIRVNTILLRWVENVFD